MSDKSLEPRWTVWAVLVALLANGGCGSDVDVKPENPSAIKPPAATSSPSPTVVSQPATGSADIAVSSAAAPAESAIAPAAAPASRAEAIAIIDLTKIPLLPEASKLTFDPTNIEFVAPTTVEASLKFYTDVFRQAGWQEHTAENVRYLAKDYGQTLFTKHGYLLSFFVDCRDRPDGTGAVLLRNFGNVDARSLPHPPGATIVYAIPSTKIYNVTDDLKTTSKNVRQEMTSRGWTEFKTPLALEMSSDAWMPLTFVQNGVELTAGVSPAYQQAGKTSVNFAVRMLLKEPLLLPGAKDVVFDERAGSLACVVPQPMAETIELTLPRLSREGWTLDRDLANVRVDGVKKLYKRGAEELLLVDMLGFPQASIVSIRELTAADLAMIEKKLAAEAEKLAE